MPVMLTCRLSFTQFSTHHVWFQGRHVSYETLAMTNVPSGVHDVLQCTVLSLCIIVLTT